MGTGTSAALRSQSPFPDPRQASGNRSSNSRRAGRRGQSTDPNTPSPDPEHNPHNQSFAGTGSSSRSRSWSRGQGLQLQPELLDQVDPGVPSESGLVLGAPRRQRQPAALHRGKPRQRGSSAGLEVI